MQTGETPTGPLTVGGRVLFAWTSDQPVAVAVLAPEPADLASGIHDVFMGLHRIAAS